MDIVKVTGPFGSGKTYLIELAAKQIEQEIFYARGMTHYAIEHVLRKTIEEKKPFAFFEEPNDAFYVSIELLKELPVRIVIIRSDVD